MPGHPIIDPLKNNILPFTANADELLKPWDYKLFSYYKFSQGFFGALVSAGITFPLARAISADATGMKEAAAMDLTKLNTPWAWLSAAGIVVWLFISQVLRHRETENKYHNAKACQNVLVDTQAELERILQFSDPRKEIGRLHLQVYDSVRRARNCGAYQFGAQAPPDPSGRVGKALDELCRKYQSMWKADLDKLPESEEV
jgi:hypothetical protein